MDSQDMIKLTEAQMNALKPFEEQFARAIDAQWCKNMTQSELLTLCSIWQKATGQSLDIKPSCPSCVLKLLVKLGTIYRENQVIEEKPKVVKSPKKRK